MNFDHRHQHEEPEINLIPLIDVLMVILIFLAATTSFSQQRQLDIALPQADAQQLEAGAPIELSIDREGRYRLDGQPVADDSEAGLAEALQQQGQSADAVLRINADGRAAHAAVVRALQAASRANIHAIHFLAETSP